MPATGVAAPATFLLSNDKRTAIEFAVEHLAKHAPTPCDEIPLAAMIIGIVDVYDALTTARSYRPALAHDAAIAEIEIDVPRQQGPLPIHGLVGVGILAAAIAVGVPVSDDVLESEIGHPLFHIDQ